MQQSLSAAARISALQAEIEVLTQSAILELKERRVDLAQELHVVECEIARMTGKVVTLEATRKRSAIVGRTPSLQELKELLSAIPSHALILRKEGIEVKHV